MVRLSDAMRSAQKREKSRIEALRSNSTDGDVGAVQPAHELVLDDRAGAEADVVHDELGAA